MPKEKRGSALLERIRRKIIVYAVLYTLVALLLISLLSVHPLVRRLKLSEEVNLLQSVRIRALAVEEHLERLTDIALLITTRDSIREALEGHYAKKISVEELKEITTRNLGNLLPVSEEIAGVTRLDRKDEVVGSAGVAVPVGEVPPSGIAGREVFISNPLVIENNLYLLVAAPVLGGGGERIGTDLILFTAHKLQRVVWNEETLKENADALLGQMSGDRAEIFFPGRRGDREIYNAATSWPLYEKSLAEAARGKVGLLHAEKGGGREIAAYAPVKNTGWGLLVTMDQADLYAGVHRQIASVAGLLLFLAVCGGAGMFLLLRPLTGRVLVYSSELEELNHGLQQEIAERGRAEENLRRSERVWAQTFEAITDAVAILDIQGNILKMNKAHLSFLGSLSKNVPSDRRCKVHFGLEKSGELCPYTRMKSTKEPEFGELYEPVDDRYFHVSVYPLLGDDGELWGGVHIAQDITEQKKMENLKDEMLSSVSHEMRTPLTAMLGFIEYMLQNPVEPEQQREFLETVHRETERLNELVSNFLDLQRLQAQMETYHFEPVPICPLLREMAHLFAVASKKHPVRLDCPHDLPAIMGDSRRLQQVLKNLLSNAIRYSPEGGEVTIGASRDGDIVIIRVQDSGMGIPPQALNRVFERFYRVDDSARRIPGGIGLGLALVREVVRAHGGRVWVESTVGRGSTFYLSVPVAKSGGQ